MCYTAAMSQAQNEQAYLGKRELKRAASKGVREASKQAMEVAGFVVTVVDGWLVRKYKDGRIEQLEKLPTVDESKLRSLVSD